VIESPQERLACVQNVLDDLPPVHVSGVMTHAPSGVWQTERSAYELLAGCANVNSATLETGCGVSTVLFAMWGTFHTCITPSLEEVERVQEYCSERDISLERVTFHVGPSDQLLPTLTDPRSLDIVFVDGGHAFPLAIIDWYYAAARLSAGGIVLIDDIHLPSVSASLISFLDRDGRWQCLARTERWAAYHKLSSGSLRDDWGLQVGLGIFSQARPSVGEVSRANLRRGARLLRSKLTR
jgi:Methyltransferase domain